MLTYLLFLFFSALKDLYGSANDPRTANDPGPQMILDRKCTWTANDPQIGPEMIPDWKLSLMGTANDPDEKN